jgi:hypothetical protein
MGKVGGLEMFGTAVVAAVVVVVTGLFIWKMTSFLARRQYISPFHRVSGGEAAFVLGVITPIVMLLVIQIGSSMAKNEVLTYEEMRAGVEVSASEHVTHCIDGHRGSSDSAGRSNCENAFTTSSYTDTYTYDRSYDCSTYTTDSKGNSVREPKTCHEDVQAHIYHPYATVEHSYSLKDSFGRKYDFPGVYLDENPVPASSRAIPMNIKRGPPADWADAKAHLDTKNPRSVKKMFPYDNIILAVKDPGTVTFSVDVPGYLKAGLLPDHTANILKNPVYGKSRPVTKQVMFVGLKVANEDVWQDTSMQYNAALGLTKQGDLHVVVVNSQSVPAAQSVSYLNALKAYWLGSHFGKRALAKNGVILVLGSDGAQIQWAQASTGMPFGNELMLATLRDELAGQPLDPHVLFGSPHTVVTPATKKGEKDKVTLTLSQPRGILERIMFEEVPFKRSCMEHCEKGEVGFGNLIRKIQPSFEAKAWMVFFTWLATLFIWIGVAFTSAIDNLTRSIGNRARRILV